MGATMTKPVTAITMMALVALSACGKDAKKEAFVTNCVQQAGEDNRKACGCVYEVAKDELTEDQMSMVSTLAFDPNSVMSVLSNMSLNDATSLMNSLRELGPKIEAQCNVQDDQN